MEQKLESLQPEIDRIKNIPSDALLMGILDRATKEAKRKARRAFRVLIPLIIVGCLCLIGIGILIGKYLL